MQHEADKSPFPSCAVLSNKVYFLSYDDLSKSFYIPGKVLISIIK